MISILMPVYNVEKYIDKTLESIQKQTYSDFEVIMVDDGSTDSSGAICDAWAEKDSRFKVTHTENRGVSAARNTALSLVKGEYIFCVDSDDIIIPETLEELMDNLIKNDADMSCGNLEHVDENLNPIEEYNEQMLVKDEVLTKTQYLKKLSEPNAGYYCHTTHNIYKKKAFDGVRFPEGRIHEDHARIHEIIYNCDKIVTSAKKYYLYIRHSQGITGTQFAPKNLAREEAYADRLNFYIEKNLKELIPDAALFALDAAIVNFTNCVKYGYYYGRSKDRIDSYVRLFAKHCPSIFSVNSFYKKILLVGRFIAMNPDFYAQYLVFGQEKAKKGIAEAVKNQLYYRIPKMLSHLPTKKVIVFESNPELSCNAYPVYRYLQEKGIGKKYKLVWLTNNPDAYNKADYPDTQFISHTAAANSFFKKIKTMKTISTAKALVYSNKLLGCYGKDRLSLCLQHGMPFKKSDGSYCIKNDCTSAVCVSEYFAPTYEADFRVEREKMIFTGFPRNDLLLKDNDALAKFGFDKYDKIIFWLPTFRQRNDSKQSDYEMSVHGTGIPAIETAEELEKVNDFLKANNCLLILKPHPVQDISVMKETKLSNFFIINDASLREKNVQLYELLGRCDAMITDYSSVYYDYLLTDKPIGLTIGDIDEYIAKRGFVYRNPLDILKGDYIYDTDALVSFLSDVKQGNDRTKNERTKIKDMIHCVQNGTSAQLVGDYIISKLDM